MLIAGVISALATTVLFFLRRRRFGSSDEAKQYQNALKSGHIPASADREQWRQVTHDSIRLSRRFRLIVGAVGALTVLLGLLSAILVTSNRIYALVLAAAFLVITVSAEVIAHQNLQRARGLQETLL